MRKRDYRDHIRDILESINDIESFIIGLSFEEFKRDRKTINAVVRSIEIIGEAAKKIPVGLRNKHPDIPWKKMAGMRDKLQRKMNVILLRWVFAFCRLLFQRSAAILSSHTLSAYSLTGALGLSCRA